VGKVQEEILHVFNLEDETTMLPQNGGEQVMQ
jgi:hypothetical protein